MPDRLPDPAEQPFLTADELHDLLQGRIGRTALYEGAKEYLRTGGTRGIPCIKAGRRTLFPTAAIRRWAMIDEADQPALRVVAS